MEVPPVMLDHIKATPTATLGWYDQELMTAWKNIFPLTTESQRLGSLPFSNPVWQGWPNPWWEFLMDLPAPRVERTLVWRTLPSISAKPLLCELNPSEEIAERQMLVDQLIAVSCLGNRATQKLIQVFHPNLQFSLMVC